MRFILPFLMLATPAFAEGTIIVSPIYAQLVAIPTPADFAAVFETETKGSYILELTAKTETADTWSQMITITGGKGLANALSVTDISGSISEGYQAACPSSFTAHTLPPPKVRGAQAVFAGYLGCGNAGSQSEAMVFLVLQGKSDIYTLQWAERGPAQDTPLVPDAAIWQPRAEALAAARICDKVAGEEPPYPSCTDE